MVYKVVVAHGDGIGPEIMEAVLNVLKAASLPFEYIPVNMGEKIYLSGVPTGIEEGAWEKILESDAFLKAPMTTPQGGGFKSINVSLRSFLGLYGNIRPCVSYAPYVSTKHPKMDVTIVRENEEDLYIGSEYEEDEGVVHALKLITRLGSERIVRLAFEYALSHSRKKVTAFTKDNILKRSDGLFHKVFDEIGAEYPQIEKEHWIVDIGAAKLADTPELFDVIVMPNLYGDILSDVAAQIAGSVGLAGSANIGEHASMFEAIHGSAPRRAGQGIANPSGLYLAAVMMVSHLNLPEKAALLQNSWLTTIEEGIHTYDIYKEGVSKKKVTTKEFSEALIKNLGKKPSTLKPAYFANIKKEHVLSQVKSRKKEIQGMDAFIVHAGDLESLLRKLPKFSELELESVHNRGVKLWPGRVPKVALIPVWKCRFTGKKPVNYQVLTNSLGMIANAGLETSHIETLYSFDGEKGYS